MGMNKVHNLVPSITDFGLKPREGFKYCIKCKSTLPEKAFYKKDLEDPHALCKKHKNKKRAEDRAIHKLEKLDTPATNEGDK
jgi:hypothetical protein